MDEVGPSQILFARLYILSTWRVSMRLMFATFAVLLCVLGCASVKKKIEIRALLRNHASDCESGLANGCFALGAIYQEGVLVPQDIFRSFEYHREACQIGTFLE